MQKKIDKIFLAEPLQLLGGMGRARDRFGHLVNNFQNAPALEKMCQYTANIISALK